MGGSVPWQLQSVTYSVMSGAGMGKLEQQRQPCRASKGMLDCKPCALLSTSDTLPSSLRELQSACVWVIRPYTWLEQPYVVRS